MNHRDKFILVFLLFISTSALYAQNKAIDENGRLVLLFSNGTWRYDVDSLGESGAATDTIQTNTTTFTKPSGKNFLIKSNVVNVGVYFNTNKWTIKPHLDNETEPEYRFTLKTDDAYALLITEKTSIDISEMRDIALLNAQKAAADAKVVKSEYRNVNGYKVLCLEITGTTKGIKFEYFGYYYSNENGTAQFVTFTSQKLFKDNYKDMEELLNGFVEIENK